MVRFYFLEPVINNLPVTPYKNNSLRSVFYFCIFIENSCVFALAGFVSATVLIRGTLGVIINKDYGKWICTIPNRTIW